ncbi:M23 family metallopeptidase [Rossellomorea vietnamensis]|uniref:M23 family metallopeptidase n=1 Tax=Rossellomorea vietnamensis TaxID=218284 RepID=UPI0009E34917|nr:M23 family metallopeptidase [Rossellomorea vietnamensis]
MKFRLSSKYGELSGVRNWEPHHGIDLSMPIDTKLRSIGDGVIEQVITNGKEIGNAVLIRMDNGMLATYGHLNKVEVNPGEHISAGDIIGLSGNSGGMTTGPHLHFSLQDAAGEYINTNGLAEAVDNLSGNGLYIPVGNVLDRIKENGAINQYSELAKGDSNWFLEWINGHAEHMMSDVWTWFIHALPDIIGYTTIGAGIFIILGSMIGKGGMIKPLAFWSGLVIAAICILMGGS